MPSFTVINRRGKQERYCLHGKDDGNTGPTEHVTHYVGASELTDPDCKGDVNYKSSITIKHWRSPLFLYFTGATTFGPYKISDGGNYVIVPGEPNVAFVDVAAAVQAALGRQDQAAGRAPSQADATNEMLAIGSILFAGLATGFSAMGPIASPMAGISQIVSGMFGAAIKEGPPPPTLHQIAQAMGDELHANEARKSAIVMTQAADTLTSAAKQAHAGADGGMPEVLAQQMQQFMGAALTDLNQGSFLSSLHYLRDNPTAAQYALAEFAAGIAVFAVLTETNLLSTYLPERIKARQIPRNWKFPVEPVANYIHDLELLRDGLIAARDQFIHMRQGLVNNAGLGGIPEGVAVVKAVSKHYVGDEYAARADGYGEGGDYLGDMGHYPANAPDRIEQAVNHLMALIEAWVAEGNRLRGNLTDWPRSVLPLPS